MVRADILPGYQVAQSSHATVEFLFDHFLIAKKWHEESDYIVVLNIDNEDGLLKLISQAKDKNINHSTYREPDLDNQYTAAAFEPGPNSKKLCRGLKLAFS